MYFQLIPMDGSLRVEGENPAVGEFAGRVVALGVRDYDPVASPRRDRVGETQVEGLWGWGTTHFLVSDLDKPAPVWVSKDDVNRHVFDPPRLASRA